jgi:hypothetical protein
MQHTQVVQEEGAGEIVVNTEAVQVPTDEWTAAALAHTSVLLTLILGMAGGIGVLAGPAIPLVMYLGYRGKSRFVAFHALQSLAYHVAGVLSYVVTDTVCIAAHPADDLAPGLHTFRLARLRTVRGVPGLPGAQLSLLADR